MIAEYYHYQPAFSEAHMNTIWTYDDGLLTAKKECGGVIYQWQANESEGVGLAMFLNHSHTLSETLLSPFKIEIIKE